MFWRWSMITAAAAAPPNAITGHGSPSNHASSGREQAETIDATEA
jgi:hypothetical protein